MALLVNPVRPPTQCCMNEGNFYSAGDVIYKAECMTIYCSVSCKVEMELNERCGMNQSQMAQERFWKDFKIFI